MTDQVAQGCGHVTFDQTVGPIRTLKGGSEEDGGRRGSRRQFTIMVYDAVTAAAEACDLNQDLSQKPVRESQTVANKNGAFH